MKPLLIAFIVFLAFGVQPARGDARSSSRSVDPVSLERCAAIRDNARRLACFDALIAPVSPLPSKLAIGRWKVSRRHSAIDDGPVVVSALVADAPVDVWPGRKVTPSLIVRCEEDELTAYVSLDATPVLNSSGDVDVTLRFDKSDAVEQQFTLSTDRGGIFSPQPDSLVAGLLRHDRLVLRVAPVKTSPVLVAWTLRGSRRALGDVLAACQVFPRASDVRFSSAVSSDERVRTAQRDALLSAATASIAPCFDRLFVMDSSFAGDRVVLHMTFPDATFPDAVELVHESHPNAEADECVRASVKKNLNIDWTTDRQALPVVIDAEYAVAVPGQPFRPRVSGGMLLTAPRPPEGAPVPPVEQGSPHPEQVE